MSTIRLPPQDEHQPRFLQENGKSRSLPQTSHRRRRKPNSLTPHLRNDRNSSSTNAGMVWARSCCLARNVSRFSTTTEYKIVDSGLRGQYAAADSCMRTGQTHALSHRQPLFHKPDSKDFDNRAGKVPRNTTIISVFFTIPGDPPKSFPHDRNFKRPAESIFRFRNRLFSVG